MIEALRQHLIEHDVLDMYCEAILHEGILITTTKISTKALFGSTFSFYRANQYFKTSVDWYSVSLAWARKYNATMPRIPFDLESRRLFVEQLKGGSKTRRLLRHVMR